MDHLTILFAARVVKKVKSTKLRIQLRILVNKKCQNFGHSLKFLSKIKNI